MAAEVPAEVTALLEQIRAGDLAGADKLLRLIQDELHRMAAGLMNRERPDHTLQPTALLNEALLRLLGGDALREAPNRRFLFAAAARTMRQILVDHARQREAAKRGGRWQRVPLDDVLDGLERQDVDVAALRQALDEMATDYERPSQVITLRYFGGFSVQEVVSLLGVSGSTVESDTRFAIAWLHGQLKKGD